MFLFGDDDENYQEQSLAGTAPPRGKSCMLQCSAATVQQLLQQYNSQAPWPQHLSHACLTLFHVIILCVVRQSHMKQALECIMLFASERCIVQSFPSSGCVLSIVLHIFR